MARKKQAKQNDPSRVFVDKLRDLIKREKIPLQPLAREMGLKDHALSNLMWSGALSSRTHNAIVARFPELVGIVAPETLYGWKTHKPMKVLARGPRRPRPVPFELKATKENKVSGDVQANEAFKLGATLANLAHQKGGQLWIEGLESAARMGLNLRDVVTQLKGIQHHAG